MQPIDVPTIETLGFVLKYLPTQRARLLEVGCGDGQLAWRLQQLGYEIIGLDSSAEAIAAATRLGFEARQVVWPHFEAKPFEAILFTRSLHHIHPLIQAVERAAQLLKPFGVVIVDEFAFDDATPATVEWLYGLLCTLESGNKLHFKEEGLIKKLLDGGGDFSLWQRNAAHDLHSVVAMWETLEHYFEPVAKTTAPYLYRYLCPLFEENDAGYTMAARMLELEQQAAQQNMITLIGRRFVGKKR